MGVVEYIHPYLAEADYRQSAVKLKFISASLIFFAAVCALTAFFSQFTRTYANLRFKEKIFWDLAVVRGIFGFFCIVIGIWVLFYDEDLEKDVVYGTTQTSYFALTVTVGFFIFECSMLLFTDMYFKQVNKMLNTHHWLAVMSFSALMYYESPHYFGTCALILEMSTPFSCLCWTLLKANLAHTFLWKANQFFLVHTFHLRSVVECYLWYQTYKHWTLIWNTMPLAMMIPLYFQLFLVTCIMTPYWTYKKTVQMINPVDWNFEDTNKNREMNGTLPKRD